MQTSDYIQIIAIIVSSLTAIVSIIIAILTLKQTNKITRESTRACIGITLEPVTILGNTNVYLVIKNYGNTLAKITSIVCSCDTSSFAFVKNFNDFIGYSLAPQQSIKTFCKFPDNFSPFSINITYEQGIHKRDKFSDSFDLDPSFIDSLFSMVTNRSNCSDDTNAIVNAITSLIASKL